MKIKYAQSQVDGNFKFKKKGILQCAILSHCLLYLLTPSSPSSSFHSAVYHPLHQYSSFRSPTSIKRHKWRIYIAGNPNQKNHAIKHERFQSIENEFIFFFTNDFPAIVMDYQANGADVEKSPAPVSF